MTELIKSSRMTSREIAEITGKEHKNVLQAIRTMAPAWEKIAGLKFQLGSYLDDNNQPRPEYRLTKVECLYIATKFNDEARARLILRWDQLEKERMVPRRWTLEESLKHQLQLIEQNRVLEARIEENKSKVVFADAVAGSNNSILVRQFAKVLSDKGFVIGQNRLFAWFRYKGYLNDRNEPYQNYVERGFFEVIERTVGAADQTFTTRTTKITGLGQVYFTEKLRKQMDIQDHEK